MTIPDITRLTELLEASRRVLVFTGAGISTSSGIPDFRGPQGVWKTRQPVMYDDFMSSRAARVAYWEYKTEAWAEFRDARPNATHRAVAELEVRKQLEAVVTQNIDGLHVGGGNSPEKVVELHGSNREVECQTCGARSDPEAHFQAFRKTGKPPTCDCEGFLKPATISFGQSLRARDLDRATVAARRCDLVIAMGSTLSVHPAASFPLIAAGRGIPYVIINRGATDHDGRPEVSLRLEGDVTEIFPLAVSRSAGPNHVT